MPDAASDMEEELGGSTDAQRTACAARALARARENIARGDYAAAENALNNAKAWAETCEATDGVNALLSEIYATRQATWHERLLAREVI